MEEEEEEKKSVDPNASLFEEVKKEDAKENESDEDEKEPQVQYKRVVLTYQQLKKSQEMLRSYPPVLLHTLFHEDPHYERYRAQEFSNLFFFGDEIKSLGNEAYHKGDYYNALDFYEQVTFHPSL